MAYFMFTSPNAPQPAYSDRKDAPVPPDKGPWTCYDVDDLPPGGPRDVMREAIRLQGYAYLTPPEKRS